MLYDVAPVDPVQERFIRPLLAVPVNPVGAVGAGGLIVNARVAACVPPVLVALIVTDETPMAVGLPEMIPVVVLTESPTGKPIALKLVGLFVAVI